jgi:hypothetical protein
MQGKLGISSIVYAKAFIKGSWDKRASMEDYERRGFLNFLYITACGHAETVIADYLKSVLFIPIFGLTKTTDFPKRKVIEDGSENLVSTEPEQRAVQRLLERTTADLERAPMDRIESLHKTICGTTVREVVGPDLHDKLNGLLAVRNVLAHGRLLYVNFEDSGIPDSTFEQHPFENAIKCLRQSGLFNANAVPADANELYSVIYRDDVIRHFWNASVELGRFYREKAAREKLVSIAWVQPLEMLAP